MKVYHALCLRDYEFLCIDKESGEPQKVELKRGKEYTVSPERTKEGETTRIVFTRYWFETPADLWGGAK